MLGEVLSAVCISSIAQLAGQLSVCLGRHVY